MLMADPLRPTEHIHSEQLVRLPEIFDCFRPQKGTRHSPSVGALNTREGDLASFTAWRNQERRSSGAGISPASAKLRCYGDQGLDEASASTIARVFFQAKWIGSSAPGVRGAAGVCASCRAQEVDIAESFPSQVTRSSMPCALDGRARGDTRRRPELLAHGRQRARHAGESKI